MRLALIDLNRPARCGGNLSAVNPSRILLPAAIALAAGSGATAHAMDSAKLADEKQCFQCHAVDHHVIGPSFQVIGAIYRRMKDPVPKMVAVIREGSEAHLGPLWDQARMPDMSERPEVSEREARQLARWILKQRAPR